MTKQTSEPPERDKRNKVAKLFVLFGGRCWWCQRPVVVECIPQGEPQPAFLATCDHYYPASSGGTHDLGNLVLACRECNCERDSTLARRWIRSLTERGLTPPSDKDRMRHRRRSVALYPSWFREHLLRIEVKRGGPPVDQVAARATFRREQAEAQERRRERAAAGKERVRAERAAALDRREARRAAHAALLERQAEAAARRRLRDEARARRTYPAESPAPDARAESDGTG